MKLHHFNVMQTLKPANNNTSVILPYNNIQTLTPYVHVVSHHDNEIILIYWPTQLHCRLCHCSESDFRSFCCLLILTPLYSHVDESLLSKLHACQQTTLTWFNVKTFSFSCAISSFSFSLIFRLSLSAQTPFMATLSVWVCNAPCVEGEKQI